MKRKVIQVTVGDEHIFALCDDGTFYKYHPDGKENVWVKMPPIPEKEDDE